MHDQAAAYVLNALDADEAQAFERHIQLCPGCEEDLEPLRIAAAALCAGSTRSSSSFGAAGPRRSHQPPPSPRARHWWSG